MNRKEIKEKAKSLIKGNIWNILWPMLVIGVITSIITTIFGAGPTVSYNAGYNGDTNVSLMQLLGTFLASIVSIILCGGYYKYLINFVRNGNFETNDIINTIKEKWLNLLISGILVGVIVGVCSLLFVIPGIIMALAYTFVPFIVVDLDIDGKDALTKSREMMKGYKMDYFVFVLSFIGWMLLAIPTLGLICIWLMPYLIIAEILYYENLKNK